MKPQFVTALYVGLEGTIFNGNSDGIYDRYRQSLKSLALGGYSIVCYTSQAHLEDLTNFFADTPNLTLIVYELKNHPLHGDINYIKQIHSAYNTSSAWRSRCVEIMWGKFYWLEEALSLLNDTDNLFWIDAGLFHGGLITNKFRSEASKNFYDFDTITQHRNLHDDLSRYANNKILNILSASINHGMDDFVDVFGKRATYGVIGGIFGGNKILLQEYINKAKAAMQDTLAKKLLLKEEELMYYLHSEEPELYTDFMFNNWYHDDWNIELYNPEIHISFSSFFKVIRE